MVLLKDVEVRTLADQRAHERAGGAMCRIVWLRRLIGTGATCDEAAKAVECTRQYLYKIASRNGLRFEKMGSPLRKFSDEDLRAVCAEGLTTKQAAKRLGAHYATVRQRAEQLGIDLRPQRAPNGSRSVRGCKPDKRELAKLSVIDRMVAMARAESAAVQNNWEVGGHG